MWSYRRRCQQLQSAAIATPYHVAGTRTVHTTDHGITIATHGLFAAFAQQTLELDLPVVHSACQPKEMGFSMKFIGAIALAPARLL